MFKEKMSPLSTKTALQYAACCKIRLKQTGATVLNSSNRLMFVMQKQCVYCEVRTAFHTLLWQISVS